MIWFFLLLMGASKLRINISRPKSLIKNTISTIFFLFLLGCRPSETPENSNLKFSPLADNYTLSLSLVDEAGTGMITVLPSGISCKTNCQLNIPMNSTIELVASTDKDKIFTNLSGGCQGTTTCIIKMNKNIDVVANFSNAASPINNILNVEVFGSGKVVIDELNAECQNSCNYSVNAGETLTFRAVVNSGNKFSGWQNECGDKLLCSIVIDKPTSLNANFNIKNNPSVKNTFHIKEPYGEEHINYPIQFGRPFTEGEISSFPQVVVDGETISSQANIKQRYPDGSVKHAIISFILPKLSANASKEISFINSQQSNNTPLTKQQMLSESFNFNAEMLFSFPRKETVSARSMLENDNFEYWLQGPIATTILLSDHSTSKTYDLGSDAHNSIRPIYQVTFWKDINKFEVRYIAENSNTETLQDQKYDIQLSSGEINSQINYEENNVFHHAKTRWSRKFWHDQMFKPLSIDHNLAYLNQTFFTPNYDTSKVIPESTISSYYDKWRAKESKLFSNGFWEKYMPAAGGRDDLGIYTTWVVRWLYTGHWKMAEISLRQSELAGSWPFFIREGRSGKFFDFENKIPALGKTLSIAPNARPSYWITKLDWHETSETDHIYSVASLKKNSWVADNAHHPDIATMQYLLTGDYYFLEQSYFSSAFGTANNAGFATNATFGRGPTGSTGALFKGQTRGQGWSLRTRAHTLAITPDTHPEKAYYSQLMKNAITAWEGVYQIDSANNSQSEVWLHGKDIIGRLKFEKYGGTPLLNSWSAGTDDLRYIQSSILDISNVNRAQAPWEQHIMLSALGRAEELGFCTSKLKKWAGELLINMLTDNQTEPALFSVFIQPVIDNQDQWFSSWQEAADKYTDSTLNNVIERVESDNIEPNMGTQAIAMGALSFLSDMEKHSTAWSYIERNILIKSELSNNPKWAILPRVPMVVRNNCRH
jgi:hypothetical protein